MSVIRQTKPNKKSLRLPVFGLQSARRNLPKRTKTSNKTHGGRAMLIAGSSGFLGAAVLAAQSAARVGAGYTYLVTSLKGFSTLRNPDFLAHDIQGANWKKLPVDAIGIGPGLGLGRTTELVLKHLLASGQGNVVVDADALTVLAKMKIKSLPATWVLTPHAGELSRMIGWTAAKIQQDRFAAVMAAAQKYSCIVLLKGHHTLVAQGERAHQINSGNPALAKAGTGDVLTGIITGLLAQGVAPVVAAQLGAFVHGRAADDWVAEGRDSLSLLASDLVNQLPFTLAKIRRSGS